MYCFFSFIVSAKACLDVLLNVVFNPSKRVDVERANTVDHIRSTVHDFLMHGLVLLVGPKCQRKVQYYL